MYGPTLTEEQNNFILRLGPWVYFLNQQTRLKAKIIKGVPFIGVYPSVAMAEILVRSQFGDHPASKEKFRGRQSNNLDLLEVDDSWAGDRTRHNGATYKMFENWQHFFIHWSDQIVFKKPQVINANNYFNQIDAFAQGQPIGYNEILLRTINEFNLTEFDFEEITDC